MTVIFHFLRKKSKQGDTALNRPVPTGDQAMSIRQVDLVYSRGTADFVAHHQKGFAVG